MSSRLGRVWSSSTAARLAQLGRPGGAETRQRPYTVRVGDRCKVRRYGGEVLIALVLALAIIPLAIIRAVAYMYSRYLKVRCFISWPRLSGYI